MKEFKFDTVSNFDKHISDSIKGYDLLDDLIVNICSFFIGKDETIVDLGCSSGRLLNRLENLYPDNNYIGYDIVDKNFMNITPTLVHEDITKEGFKIPKCNIVLSVFTLQFLNYTERCTLIRKIYDSLEHNGIFIVCEKTIHDIGIFQNVFTFSNWDYKKQNFTET